MSHLFLQRCCFHKYSWGREPDYPMLFLFLVLWDNDQPQFQLSMRGCCSLEESVYLSCAGDPCAAFCKGPWRNEQLLFPETPDTTSKYPHPNWGKMMCDISYTLQLGLIGLMLQSNSWFVFHSFEDILDISPLER